MKNPLIRFFTPTSSLLFIYRDTDCNHRPLTAFTFNGQLPMMNLNNAFCNDQAMNIENNIFVGKLDLSNMGAFGHSFGGAASGQLCLEDDRINAFINMDGSPFGDAPDREIDQPFMILTHGGDEKSNFQYCSVSIQRLQPVTIRPEVH